MSPLAAAIREASAGVGDDRLPPSCGPHQINERRLCEASRNEPRSSARSQPRGAHAPVAGILVDLPGGTPLALSDLLIDFNGTLACDGQLLPGVAERLDALARHLRVTVLTADTFGTAATQLAGLPLRLHTVRTGHDKATVVNDLGGSGVAAVGNGRNDVAMVRGAALGVVVLGPEGCAGELLAAATVVCHDIQAAMDLLLNPVRLTATLRP